MTRRLVCTLAVFFIALPVTNAQALTITFENFAPPGSLVNVSPGTPYTESGFTFTPTTSASAVFDSAAATDFPGDLTDFFGFEENNIITLTGPAPFDLASLIVGPITLSSTPTISMTIVGNLFGGGTLTINLIGLSTATPVVLNWTNLQSVVFRTTNDSGLDNLVINQVPEPASLVLLGAGAVAAGARRFRRHRSE